MEPTVKFLHLSLLFGFLIASKAGDQGLSSAPAGRPPSRILHSGSWRAEIMDPTHPQRYNKGARFTPVAVLQVWKDTTAFCYRPDNHDPVLENAGLSGEFDIITSPPGFEEAAIDEGFVKIGVGVLKKSAATYDFWPQHEIVERAKTTVKWSEDRADFIQICNGVNGYAYSAGISVLLGDGELKIEWTLTNTGTKTFTTFPYNHNFFQFQGRPQITGYELAFPYAIEAPTGNIECLSIESNVVRVLKPPVPPGAINVRIPYPQQYAGKNWVRLVRPSDGQEVICEVSEPGSVTAFHASSECVCPEQVIKIHLEPAETKKWTWTYRFQVNDTLPNKAYENPT